MAIPHAEGWPTDRGPLKTLRDAGLLPDGDDSPSWLRHATVESGSSFHAKAPFMSNVALRHLAALSPEGWDVLVKSAIDGLSIKIKRRN